LREINQSLVRASNRGELFERTCQLLVERGGFDVAWIGWFDVEQSLLKPVARFGARSELLDRVRLDADEQAQGPGPTRAAFQSGEPVVLNDMTSDPSLARWHDILKSTELVSAAAFPIRERGTIVGTLSVYSDESETSPTPSSTAYPACSISTT
jgi:GAF domain-containing protein